MPTIFVEFSEDVSNDLSVYSLELVNTTNSEQVPFGLMGVNYNAGTNVASFTFPGYPDGKLPAGDYTAMIYGSLPDLYGNPMNVETPFQFSIVAPLPALLGDYNQDNVVDAADYTVWRNALGQTGVLLYSGADGNGDGMIGPEDYAVWKAHFGESLPNVGSGAIEAVAGDNSLAASVLPAAESEAASDRELALVKLSSGVRIPAMDWWLGARDSESDRSSDQSEQPGVRAFPLRVNSQVSDVALMEWCWRRVSADGHSHENPAVADEPLTNGGESVAPGGVDEVFQLLGSGCERLGAARRG